MTDHEILKAFAELSYREEQIGVDRRNLLRKLGWDYTSDTPASLWMFQKTLPNGRVVITGAGVAEEMETANLDRSEFDEEE